MSNGPTFSLAQALSDAADMAGGETGSAPGTAPRTAHVYRVPVVHEDGATRFWYVVSSFANLEYADMVTRFSQRFGSVDGKTLEAPTTLFTIEAH